MILSNEEVALDDLAQRINAEHELCAGAARTSLEHALAAGALLIEAKVQVPYGQWTAWLQGNCTATERVVQIYMRLAHELPARLEERGETVLNTVLTITEARALVAEPRTLAPPELTLWDRVMDGAPAPQVADEEPPARHSPQMAPPTERPRPAPSPVLPLTPAVASQRAARETLDERWKREDVVHRALQAIEHMLRFDAAEAGRLHAGATSLSRHLLQNDIDTAQEARTWLGTYIEAVSAQLGVLGKTGPTLLREEGDGREKA